MEATSAIEIQRPFLASVRKSTLTPNHAIHTLPVSAIYINVVLSVNLRPRHIPAGLIPFKIGACRTHDLSPNPPNGVVAVAEREIREMEEGLSR